MTGSILGIADICHYGKIYGKYKREDSGTFNSHLPHDGMARRGCRSTRRADEYKV